MTTSMNERTHFFINIYISHTLFSKGLMLVVWEVSWRRGQTATYWPKALLTIAALLSHYARLLNRGSLRAASPQFASWFSRWHLVPQLTPTPTGTDPSRLWHWLYLCLTYTCFRLFTLVHLLIDGSVEGQYVTWVLVTAVHELFFYQIWSVGRLDKSFQWHAKKT